MNKSKLRLLTFILLVIFSTKVFSQLSALKWVMILDQPDEIIYIDTAQTKVIGNQLSVWVLTKFRETRSLVNLSTPVKEFKTQYLFNRRNDRYSIIGNLYYDEYGKLLDQPTRLNFPGRRGSFSKKIPENSSIQIIREKAEEFIKTGTVTIGESRYLAEKEDLNKSPEELITPSGEIDSANIEEPKDVKGTELTEEIPDSSIVADTLKADEPVIEPVEEVAVDIVEAVKDSVKTPPPVPVKEIEDRANFENDEPEEKIIPIEKVKIVPVEKENVDEEPESADIEEEPEPEVQQRTVMEEVTETVYREIYDPVNDTYIKVPSGNRKVMREKVVSDNSTSPNRRKAATSANYNNSAERMVRQGIYTDGNLFLIQVLAGRNKAAAEAVVDRLKRRGHNAFLTETFIKSKNATYYRVRVGYFYSLREAQNYKSKL